MSLRVDIQKENAIQAYLLNALPKANGQYDLTYYVLEMLELVEEMDDQNLFNQLKEMRSNELYLKFITLSMESSNWGSADSKYYSRCIYLMLVSIWIGNNFSFETGCRWDVRVTRMYSVFAISFHDVVKVETVAVDVWDTNLETVLTDVVKRIAWLEAGNKAEDYPIQTQVNVYKLKDAVV